MTKEVVFSAKAPAALGPYSQGIAVFEGKTVYLSGQLGLSPTTGELVSTDFEQQVRQAFANLSVVAEAAGGSLAHVVKFTLFLTDLSQFAIVNTVMNEIVPQPFPARSTIGVASLPKNGLFEVEAILHIA